MADTVEEVAARLDELAAVIEKSSHSSGHPSYSPVGPTRTGILKSPEQRRAEACAALLSRLTPEQITDLHRLIGIMLGLEPN